MFAAESNPKPAATRSGRPFVFFGLVLVLLILVFLFNASLQDINSRLVHPSPTGPVSLRPLPHPYSAAVALNIKPGYGLKLDRYTDLLRQLNSPRPVGFGLEAGGSFFFFPPDGDWPAYFNPPGPEGQPVRRVFNALIRSGLIDVLDSYGGGDGLNRDSAKRALAELESQGLILRTWSDRFGNLDDLGHDLGRGAYAGRMAYHLDLTREAGFDFFQLGRQSRIVGQNAPIYWSSLFNRFDPASPVDSLGDVIAVLAKRFALVLTGDEGDLLRSNKLIAPTTLPGEVKVMEYVTFRPPGGQSVLGAGLSAKALDHLIRLGGEMILTPVIEPGEKDSLLSPEDRTALERLSGLYHEGRVMVTTTTRLLNYTAAHDYLVWSAETKGQDTVINLEAIDDPIKGRRPPQLNELAGLTFYVPQAARASILVNGRKVKTIQHLLDYTGRESVSIPWPRLVFPNLPNLE